MLFLVKTTNWGDYYEKTINDFRFAVRSILICKPS